MNISMDRLFGTFDMLEDWEERYRYIIDLGRKLPPFPEDAKSEENKVRGCISQVWMIPKITETTPPRIEFLADSDSHIVKGLIAILMIVYSGKTTEEIRATNIKDIFQKLDLEEHLSPNRRNGFFSIVERIQFLAQHSTAESETVS